MPELRVLSGLPASGKSTYAKELIRKDRSWGRVNRDELRETMFGSHWSPINEKIIIRTEQDAAIALLVAGKNVVVDDTNLGDKHFNMWNDLALNIPGVKFSQLTFSTPIDECIKRDLARTNPVGRNVIVKMAARYGLINWPDKDIVLVDIDGTLALSTGRNRHLIKQPKDWEKYFEELDADIPVTHIFKWVKELSTDHTIVVVSARGAENEERTLQWFEKIWSPNPLFPELEVPRFPVFQYFFRNKDDRRPDDIVKEEVLKLLPRKPVLVIDDRPRVVKMWRKNNIRVIPVAGECEDF